MRGKGSCHNSSFLEFSTLLVKMMLHDHVICCEEDIFVNAYFGGIISRRNILDKITQNSSDYMINPPCLGHYLSLYLS